jgi:hypothetical protein
VTHLATASPIESLVVRRSTLRTWLAALAGIPAIVFGVDVVFRKRIVSWLTDRVFADSDPQLLEPRDTIWAWALIVVGALVVAWGLKELFSPAPVIRTDEVGIHVRMLGPFRPATTLPWWARHDIDAGTLEDDDESLDVLIIEVKDPTLLPLDPWAGRRFDERTLALYSTEWDRPADEVAEVIADQAVRMARHAPLGPAEAPDHPAT